MKGFASKAIHGAVSKKDIHGALRVPVYDNAAFEVGLSRDLELAFEGKKAAHAYSRVTNPTVEDFEQRVRLISDSFGVVAVSSGMAAIAETLLALAESGSNIVTSPFLFGHTLSLFQSTLKRWGLDVRYVDMTVPNSLEKAIDDKTRLVFLEVITNPQLEVADFSKVSAIAASRGVPVVLDGTLTTPYLFRSKDSGIAVEVISSTKYMSGGATSIGGVIIDNGVFDWRKSASLSADAAKVGPAALTMRLRRDVHRNLGACLSPHNAWLQSLGLETLALRVDQSCRNAQVVAEYLGTHTNVHKVNYPGLRSSRSYESAKRQFKAGFGGLLTFELGSKDECFRFMDSLTMIKRATNLNDNKTLILHPASTIFADYSPTERERMLVSEGLIRLSLGIEDADDIVADIKQGLDKL